jgi:hypothetical protein
MLAHHYTDILRQDENVLTSYSILLVKLPVDNSHNGTEQIVAMN